MLMLDLGWLIHVLMYVCDHQILWNSWLYSFILHHFYACLHTFSKFGSNFQSTFLFHLLEPSFLVFFVLFELTPELSHLLLLIQFIKGRLSLLVHNEGAVIGIFFVLVLMTKFFQGFMVEFICFFLLKLLGHVSAKVEVSLNIFYTLFHKEVFVLIW